MQMLFKVVSSPAYFGLLTSSGIDKTASQVVQISHFYFKVLRGQYDRQQEFQERAESLISLSVSNKVGRLNFSPFSVCW